MAEENAPSTVKRKGGRSRLLTHAVIAQAAFALVDAEGEEALTVARLARRLGCGTMTLYGYVESKSAIVAMLPGVLLDDLPPLGVDGPWDAVIEDCYSAVYQRLIVHRHVTQAIARAPVFGEEQVRLFEAILAVLDHAGFSVEEAVSMHRTLRTYTLGYALLQISYEGAESPRRAWLEALEPEEFPFVTKQRDAPASAVDADQYLRGLRDILAGCAVRAAVRPAGASSVPD
ncbi:MAG: tetR 8 [Solirubrobacterales bacterium]|nr:tetR 8 [Solirubrobacterales bacterium]